MNQGLPPDNWDTHVRQLGGGILQSRPWAVFQQALGRELVWDSNDDWCWLASVRRSHGLSYLMCGYGPVAEDDAAMRTAMSSIVRAAQRLHLDFVRIEPQAHARTRIHLVLERLLMPTLPIRGSLTL